LDKNGFRHKYWYLNEWWYSIWYQLNLSLSLITQLIIRTKLYIYKYINCSVKLFFFSTVIYSLQMKFIHPSRILACTSLNIDICPWSWRTWGTELQTFFWVDIYKIDLKFFFYNEPKKLFYKKTYFKNMCLDVVVRAELPKNMSSSKEPEPTHQEHGPGQVHVHPCIALSEHLTHRGCAVQHLRGLSCLSLACLGLNSIPESTFTFKGARVQHLPQNFSRTPYRSLNILCWSNTNYFS
jgi:hypothetical protein